jgi:hypothetical protein
LVLANCRQVRLERSASSSWDRPTHHRWCSAVLRSIGSRVLRKVKVVTELVKRGDANLGLIELSA